MALRTRDVMQHSGLDRETLRFYEDQGLLGQVERDPNGYRKYSPDTLVYLEFIQVAKHAGFTLREIQQMLSIKHSSELHALQAAGQKKLEQLDERIGELQRMRTFLDTLLSRPQLDFQQQCPVLGLFHPGGEA